MAAFMSKRESARGVAAPEIGFGVPLSVPSGGLLDELSE